MNNIHGIKKNKNLTKLAREIINTRDDLYMVKLAKPKIAVVESHELKTTGRGTKIVFGECKLIPKYMAFCCDYDFEIIIYVDNCSEFTEEMYRILLWHELKHIGISTDGVDVDFYTQPHDYEEFETIINEVGLNWSNTDGK